MKTLLVIFLFVLVSPETPAQPFDPTRLSPAVQPLFQRIDLTVDPRLDSYTGEVAIDLTTTSPADSIRLHGEGFQVTRADDVDDYVRAQMQKKKIPGLSLAVVREGRVVKAQGYGLASLELQVPATAHTVYEIGSISKQFTATVVMMLVEEGNVKLGDSIAHYLSGLPAAWKGVTIRHLLTHTSGIPDFEAVIGYDSYRNIYTNESLLGTVRDSAMDFPPGEKWNYSNTGYFLLGMLLEKVIGNPYPRIIQERIFKPLGMSESRDSEPGELIPNRAAGYAIEGKAYRNRDPMQPTACKGAGTLVSTVTDMAVWDSALYTDRLLKMSSLDTMWTPVRLNDGKTFPYGFGWFLEPWQGHKDLNHSGGTAGFTTDISRFTDDHLSVIILTNCYARSIGRMGNTIAGLYVSALAPPVYKSIPDNEPTVTAFFRRVSETRMHADSLWDASWFTPEFWTSLKPGLSQIREYATLQGPVISVALIERTNDGDSRRYRYRVVYKEISRLVLMILNRDGKISEMRGEEE